MNDSARIRRLAEIGARIDIIEDERRSVVSRVGWLFEVFVARESELGEDVALRALSLCLSR